MSRGEGRSSRAKAEDVIGELGTLAVGLPVAL